MIEVGTFSAPWIIRRGPKARGGPQRVSSLVAPFFWAPGYLGSVTVDQGEKTSGQYGGGCMRAPFFERVAPLASQVMCGAFEQVGALS